MELYEERLALSGKRSANWRFARDVIKLFRPSIIRPAGGVYQLNNYGMFKHYFKIAWRGLFRQKMYTGIKIGGFAIGIAACLLIALFIRDELSYDRFYKHGDRVYRLLNVQNDPNDFGKWTAFPAQIGQVIRDNFDEVEYVSRIIYSDWFDAGDNQFRPEEHTQNVHEEKFVYADPDLLEILEIPMAYGTRSSALDQPYSIVLSRSKAEKYFPNENPVGKTIFLNNDETVPYQIGGVMEDLPTNTHLHFDFILTLVGVEFWPGEQTNWCCWNYRTFVKVKPNTDIARLEEKLLMIRDNFVYKFAKDGGDVRAEDIIKYYSIEMQPIADVYLKSDGLDTRVKEGDMKVIWLFGSVAGFILLLACVNFINLSTAKSANRAKEVGLRKVVGSLKTHLVRQFLAESFVYCFISFAIGVLIALTAMPWFNELANKSLSFPWQEWWLAPLLLSFIISISVLAGLYPSFYLSAFKPIDVLKGKLSRGSKNSYLQGSMVVFQFTTSIVLIICTMVTFQQMDFILNTKIGFDKEQIVMVQGTNTLENQQKTFIDELKRLSVVKNATATDYYPVSKMRRDQNGFWKEGEVKEKPNIGAQIWRVDEGYLNTMGMKLKEGRNFSPDIASDSTSIIINESMAKELGLENPIGERITNDFQPTFHVIGVVEDFHFESMKQEIGSLCLAYDDFGSIVSVKVKSNDMGNTLTSMEQVWNDFMPNQQFRYTFLDDQYAQMYDGIRRTSRVFTIFSGLAIIIACLGLFALSAYMVEQRSKEISIRKVLGASLTSIFGLLTISFVRYVLIAITVAVPLGWYLMNEWLTNYTYRIEMGWGVFVVSGVVALLIAILTISSESIKAGMVNPANKLKSE